MKILVVSIKSVGAGQSRQHPSGADFEQRQVSAAQRQGRPSPNASGRVPQDYAPTIGESPAGGFRFRRADIENQYRDLAGGRNSMVNVQPVREFPSRRFHQGRMPWPGHREPPAGAEFFGGNELRRLIPERLRGPERTCWLGALSLAAKRWPGPKGSRASRGRIFFRFVRKYGQHAAGCMCSGGFH